MADAWQDYFEPGETLIWEGAPSKRPRPTMAVLGLALFGLPFLAVGVGVSFGGLLVLLGFEFGWDEAAGGIFMFLFGLPFAAAGAGIVFGPYYAASQAHKRVRYALSNRRAYIASQWWNRNMEVLPIAPDAPVEIENGQTVYFHSLLTRDSDGDRTTKRKGFENIADAMKVYRLIRDIQTTEGSASDD